MAIIWRRWKRAAICGVGSDEVRKGVRAIMLMKSIEESKNAAKNVLKRGQWPMFFFSKKGMGGIARKTYLSAVGDVPPTNLFEYKDVGHTDEAKKEVLKVFDGQSPFATPKPERLIKRVLEIATDEGDLVLDSFLGSGTTAAVAHKMGRRWIGIEMGEHAKTHCAVRLKKVVDGEQGGISKAVKWNGGGGLRYYELGGALLDEKGQLSESIPYDVLAAHIWWQETGRGWNVANVKMLPVANASSQLGNGNIGIGNTSTMATLGKSTVLGVHGGTAYVLLYNGILKDRSVNGGNVLTRKTLEVIQADLAAARVDARPPEYEKIVVYGEACRLMASTLEALKIEFRQTPYDLVTRR